MPLTKRVLIGMALGVTSLALLASGAVAAGRSSESSAQPQFLWGAWIGTQFTGSSAPWSWDAVTQFEAQNAGGKHLSVVHWGVGVPWVHQFKYYRTMLDRVQDSGARSLVDMGTGSVSLHAIARGAHASAFLRWARQARSWGHPLLLRFDWEMNGSWFPWGTARSSKNRAADFVAAWRRVHRIFTSAHATNVSWVWCPNIDPYKIFTGLAKLYPGRAYVNWTCLDGYNDGAPWTSFAALYGRSYKQIARLAPTKPMLLGEIASTGQGGSKARWINGMFEAIRTRFRHIHGVVWWDSYGPPRPRDWPIESDQSASVAFSRGIGRTLARTCRGLSGNAQTQCMGGSDS